MVQLPGRAGLSATPQDDNDNDNDYCSAVGASVFPHSNSVSALFGPTELAPGTLVELTLSPPIRVGWLPPRTQVCAAEVITTGTAFPALDDFNRNVYQT
jgi:hypothetical protein